MVDAEEGLQFLGSEQQRIVGPWRFDDEVEPPHTESPAPIAGPTAAAMAPMGTPSQLAGDLLRTPAVEGGLSSETLEASKLVLSDNVSGLAREQYRRLAATLQEVQAERAIKVVMITSALAAEGKTLTAANLALTLAESFNRQVALIEADLRCPAIHGLFGLNGESRSLGEVFAGDPVQLVQVRPALAVFAPGDRLADPITALSSAPMRRMLEAVRARYDWVIVDTPPIGLLPDAHVLASLVDAAVLVVAAGRTSYPAVQRACQVIGPRRVIGVVLNRADRRALDTSARGYEQYYAAETGNS